MILAVYRQPNPPIDEVDSTIQQRLQPGIRAVSVQCASADERTDDRDSGFSRNYGNQDLSSGVAHTQSVSFPLSRVDLRVVLPNGQRPTDSNPTTVTNGRRYSTSRRNLAGLPQ